MDDLFSGAVLSVVCSSSRPYTCCQAYLRVATTRLAADHAMLFDQHHSRAINLLQPPCYGQSHSTCPDDGMGEVGTVRRRS
jgi:hypothetical protein